MNGWQDETKAVYLAASLKGHAQAILGDLDEWSRKDFSSLVTALSCRFGTEKVKQIKATSTNSNH